MGLEAIFEATKKGLLEEPGVLIKELEAKSKWTLAKRVEEIAWQVRWTSTDWRAKLQEELSWDEQKEMREALPWSWLEKIFSKWMTAQEKIVQSWMSEMSKIIPGWEDVVNKIQQASSWGEKISAAMDTAWKLFNEWKIFEAIWVFFSWLFGFYNNWDWISDKVDWMTQELRDKMKAVKGNIENGENRKKYLEKLKIDLPNNIAKKYWVDFEKEPEKLVSLTKLIDDSYWKLDEKAFKQLAEKIKNPTKDGLFVWDTFWVFQEVLTTSGFFSIWLISRWIIPSWTLALDVMKSWADSVILTLNTIWWMVWLKKVFNLGEFWKTLEWMTEKQKEEVMAILYRKWWLFFSLMWEIWYWWYKLVNAALTDTAANWFKVFPRALTNDYPKLIEDFKNIERSLWIQANNSSAPMLVDALENTKKVHMNYWLLQALEESWYNKGKFLEIVEKNPLLKWQYPSLLEEIQRIPSWSVEEAKLLWQKVSNSLQSITLDSQWTVKWMAWKFINNQEWRLLSYNQHLDDVIKMQKRLALESKWWLSRFKKVFESMDVAQVSRSWDRLVFSFNNEASLKKWLAELNQAWPEVVRWVLGKLPIIALWWSILASEDKIQALKNEIWYLLPLVWPVMMISKAWIDTNWNIVWLTDASIWAALLTIDWFHLMKLVWTSSWITEWAVNIAKYVWKPVVDIFEVVQWATRFSYTTLRSLSVTTIESFEALTARLASSWLIKNAWIVALLVVAYFWYEFYKSRVENPLSKEQIANWGEWIPESDKVKAIPFLVQKALQVSWFWNIDISVEWKIIKIDKTKLAWIIWKDVSVDNTFIADKIKESLASLHLSWYEIKLV